MKAVLTISRTFTFTVLVLFELIFTAPSYGDETSSLLPRCGQTDFDLCGYVDEKIWQKEFRNVFIIEPVFEVAREFSEGLAAVRVEGKYGYIGTNGVLKISPQFDQAGVFDQGLAVAGSHDKLGIIDRSGNFVVEPMFEKATVFNEKVFLAKSADNSESTLGAHIHTALSDKFKFPSITRAGLYNIQTGWLTEQSYSFDRFDRNNRNLVWASVSDTRTGFFGDLYGLMREDGTWLVEPKYSYGTELIDDRAAVRIRKQGISISGAIDRKGREVVPFKFDYLTHWKNGFLKARIGEYSEYKWGIVNSKGELLAGRYFDEIERRHAKHAKDQPSSNYFTVKDGQEWKSLSKEGVLMPYQKAGDVYLECEHFIIHYDTAGYALKPKDTALPTVKFDRMSSINRSKKCVTPFLVNRGDNTGMFLQNGSIFGGFFESSRGFFGDHLWVKVDGKWGLVNALGNFAIAPIYDSVEKENGFIAYNMPPQKEESRTFKVVKSAKLYRLFFRDGKYFEEVYAELKEDRSLALVCNGGNKRKSKNGLWGIVDKKGDYIISPRYRAISCFHRGVAWVPDDVDRQWCPIDKHGQSRSSPKCKEQHTLLWTHHMTPEEFHEDPYENNVLWMKAWLDYHEGRRTEEPKLIPW